MSGEDFMGGDLPADDTKMVDEEAVEDTITRKEIEEAANAPLPPKARKIP